MLTLTDPPRLVFLSSCTPLDTYIIDAVAQRWPIAKILRIQWGHAQASRWQRLRAKPLDTLVRFAERHALYRWSERRHLQQVTDELYGAAGVPELPNVHDLPEADVNRPATAELLRSLETDLLLVTAAPLLKPLIYRAPRWGAVNLHRGLATHYRGEHTIFWPLFDRAYEGLGVTLHRIDDGIDTGEALATGAPSLEPGDGPAQVTAKIIRLAAELLLRFLEHAAQPAVGERLNLTQGRLYRTADRRAWHDAALALRGLCGERCPRQTGWRRYYFASPQGPRRRAATVLSQS